MKSISKLLIKSIDSDYLSFWLRTSFLKFKFLSLRYLKPAKLNEIMLIDAQVVKYGSKIAFLEARFYIKKNNLNELKKELLIAKGSHTKFIL